MIIGLTGGIASGKSTAARYLAEKGASVIDADILGHRAYDPGTQAFDEVVEAFGADVVGADGQVDRKVLGGKVFGHPDGLKQLTDIVWPAIRRMAEEQIASLKAQAPDTTVILEAAVLFEAGWEDAVDEVWVIVTERETAIARAMARDGADEQAIQKRIDAQLSNEERRDRADVALENSADEAAMCALLDTQWARITA
ncbi:MAG: phosphopantetheine adenylyltransferase/dephospho-CoA kinase [Gammaproteobacteria bacterium]|jgi:phosphopantetheine adenylyltransferase/dephospho-CoA kinase